MDVGDTLGALLIGALVTMTIYGITTLQMYFYYMHFPKDSSSLKLLVALIWTLDTLHVVFMCRTIHYYLISEFGNPLAQVDATWSLFASLLVNVVMAFVVQCFFTERIHRLCPRNKRLWISSIIALSVLAHFCFGIETAVLLIIKKQFSRLKEVSLIGALPFAVFAIISDIFIAGALCILLATNRSEFSDTNNIIDKLIIYAINRCILTTAMAIVEVVVFIVLPNSFYSFAIDFVIGKLYANSLLATLNSRNSLRDNDDSAHSELSTSFNLASVAADHQTHTSVVNVRNRESVVSVVDVEGKDDSAHTNTVSTRRSKKRNYNVTSV